jgi:hypothetical protein
LLEEANARAGAVDTPLEQGPRDLLLQGIIFDHPFPKGETTILPMLLKHLC